MKAYRRQWDDNKLIFADAPLHDWSSDYCDCLRYVALAVGLLGFSPTKTGKRSIEVKSDYNLETLFSDNETRFRETLRIS